MKKDKELRYSGVSRSSQPTFSAQSTQMKTGISSPQKLPSSKVMTFRQESDSKHATMYSRYQISTYRGQKRKILNKSEQQTPSLGGRCSPNSDSIFATEIQTEDRKQHRKSDSKETYKLLKSFCVTESSTLDQIKDNDKAFIEGTGSCKTTRLGPLRLDIPQPKIQEFRLYYKEMDRFQEYQQFLKVEPNIYGRMNNKLSINKLVPRSMNLIQQPSDRLQANSLFGSDNYVEVFAEGLASANYRTLKQLTLRGNQIDSKRMSLIANKLPTSLTEMDLSNNNIGSEGAKSLSMFIQQRECYLQILVLEDNKLKDFAAQVIIRTLMESRTIKILNLSNNQLSDNSTESLAQLLKKSSSLLELYLHYNQIRNTGGVIFFKSLFKNQYLKVLDLSFNKLGSDQACSQAIADVIQKPHPELTHLDLSYNNFNNEDGSRFHKAFLYNPNIYGFHFEGTQIDYAINPRGYLVNTKEQLKIEAQKAVSSQAQSQIFIDSFDDRSNKAELLSKISKLEENFQFSDPKFFKRIQGVQCTNNRTKDNCWICEGWYEVKFQWILNKSGRFTEYPIFLHLDFDDYRPMIMQQVDQNFELTRMCPPNRIIKYFFSNPLLDLQFIAKDQKTLEVEDNCPLRNGVPMKYADGTCMMSAKISIVNYLKTEQNKKVIDSVKHYIPTINCRPRELEKIFDIDPKMAKQRVWSIENSIFKDYQADTEGHLMDCFEFDFDCGKLQKHIPNNEDYDEVKSKMRQVYKNVLSCYKYYCSQSANYELPLVDQSAFLEFVLSTSILDKNQINNIDLQLAYMSSYVVQKQNEYIYVQDKCLVRFQFLEVIIRLAKEQYYRTGQCTTVNQSIDRLFKSDNVLSLLQNFGLAQDWRDNRYWTQLMDATIKHKLPALQMMFDYATKMTFKNERHITLMDFKQFFDQMELSKYVTEKELYLIYLQSMQTQRNELNDSRHMEMNFLEFVEAIARLAEKISPLSPMYTLTIQLTKASRKALPLFVKFEGLIYIMFTKLRSQFALKNEVYINGIEKDIVLRTILKTQQAKRMGIYEEDKESEDEDQLKVKVISRRKSISALLPQEEELAESPKKKVSTANGWSKVRRSLIQSKRNALTQIESANIMKNIQTFQSMDEENQKVYYENADTYDRYEMKKKLEKVKELQKPTHYVEPIFKFEEQLEQKQ